MPEKFDPYREALVVETEHHLAGGAGRAWPSPSGSGSKRQLHADPATGGRIWKYVRLPTGFCRPITVSRDADLRTDLSKRRRCP